MEKYCGRCKQPKPISEFGVLRSAPSGVNGTCKKCSAARSLASRNKNLIAARESQRLNQKANRRLKTEHRLAVWNSPEAVAERAKVSEGLKRARNDRKNLAKRVKYAADPRPFAESNKKSKAARREDVRAYYRAAYRVQRESAAFVVNTRMRNRMNIALSAGKGGRSWQELTGYTLAELMQHLERQFLTGMSWENRSAWHIDHIVPLAAFDIEDAQSPAFLQAWALSNLRPIWAEDNMAKGASRVALV